MAGLFWALIGCLIGISAAQRKGFNMAAGIIGGLLLGPLAFLMYLCSGERRKCPFCAEWTQKEAKVCPHCKKELQVSNLEAENSINFHCPHCRIEIQTDKKYLGKSGKCPNCNKEIMIACDSDAHAFQPHPQYGASSADTTPVSAYVGKIQFVNEQYTTQEQFATSPNTQSNVSNQSQNDTKNGVVFDAGIVRKVDKDVIRFHCPECKKALESNEKYLGDFVNCPYCNKEIIVDYDLDYCAAIQNIKLSSANTTSSKHPVNSITTRPFQFNEKTQKRPTTPPPLNPIKSNSNANDEKRISYRKESLVFVLLLIAIFGCIIGIIIFKKHSSNIANKTEYEALKKRIILLLDEGAKIQSLTRIGANYEELSQACVSLDANCNRFFESIPLQYIFNDDLKYAEKKMRAALTEWKQCLFWMEAIKVFSGNSSFNSSLRKSYRKDITKSLDEAYIHYQSAHDSLLKFMEEQGKKR